MSGASIAGQEEALAKQVILDMMRAHWVMEQSENKANDEQSQARLGAQQQMAPRLHPK